MRVYREMLLSVVCTGIALAGSQLTRAQDATSAILPERSEPVESAPTPVPKTRTSKASVEILAKTPSQKPAPVAEDTSRAEELATPAAAEKKTRAKRRATSAAQPNASEFPIVSTMSMSAAKEMAISAPLPEYPYQARRANITGSGVCVMIVDTASGNVTSALMAESTGNAILDKVTTDTFRKWRFKPGVVSQVRVPINYE